MKRIFGISLPLLLAIHNHCKGKAGTLLEISTITTWSLKKFTRRMKVTGEKKSSMFSRVQIQYFECNHLEH